MSETPTPTDGKTDLIDERPLTGIVVHLVCLVTGPIGGILAYSLAKHPFTQENARNALNWTLTVTLLGIVTFIVMFIAGAASSGLTLTGFGHPRHITGPAFPAPLTSILKLVTIGLLLLLALSLLLSIVFVLISTAKALFGTAWKYPFALDIVEYVE